MSYLFYLFLLKDILTIINMGNRQFNREFVAGFLIGSGIASAIYCSVLVYIGYQIMLQEEK